MDNSFLNYLISNSPALNAQTPSVGGDVAPPQSASPMNAMMASGQTPSPNAAVPAAVDPQGNPIPLDAQGNPQPHEVSEITATAPHDKGPADPSFYENSTSAKDVVRALANEPAAPGGSINPGLWGMLPKQMQHGTLRNVIGALGDAFLIHAGQQPEYEQRMQQQKLGIARAGFDQNPEAAIAREAATGVPGSVEMADKDEQSLQNLKMRQLMFQNQQHWEQERAEDRATRTQATQASTAERFQPGIGGRLAKLDSIKDPKAAAAAYGQIYSSYAPLAQRLGGDPSSIFSLPHPEEWQPGMTSNWGMSRNNEAVDIAKTAQRGVSVDNSVRSANARTGAAGIIAGSRQPTIASMLQGLMKIPPAQRTPEQQAFVKRYTDPTGKTHAQLINPGPGGGTNPNSGFQNNHVYVDKNGNQARYVNGKFQPL